MLGSSGCRGLRIEGEGKRKREGSTSFLKKRSKKLFPALRAQLCRRAKYVGAAGTGRNNRSKWTEVFWFFFSKKNRFLRLP
jgi:hypothetical protein